MASANNYPRYAMALLTIVVSATLFWFGNGLNPIWPLMWIAPLPVLVFATRNSWRATAVTAFFSVWLGSLNLWHYLRILGAPPAAWLVIFTIAALVFMAAVLLFRALLLRGAVWSALVAFPAGGLCMNSCAISQRSGGTAGSFAYSQLSFLPFLQLASLTGSVGHDIFPFVVLDSAGHWMAPAFHRAKEGGAGFDRRGGKCRAGVGVWCGALGDPFACTAGTRRSHRIGRETQCVRGRSGSEVRSACSATMPQRQKH